jgi:hypothetical protein
MKTKPKITPWIRTGPSRISTTGLLGVPTCTVPMSQSCWHQMTPCEADESSSADVPNWLTRTRGRLASVGMILSAILYR